MTYATLVTKHPRWSRHERAAYGGQTVVLTDRTDYKGQREGLVISGMMTGVYRWWSEDEIAEESKEEEVGQ